MEKKGSTWLALVVISGLVFFAALYFKQKNHNHEDSTYVGQIVAIPENAKLGKLKGYGGAMDEYHYLLPDETDLFKDTYGLYDVIDITELTLFRVVEEKFISNHRQCIFEDKSGQTFGAECEDIEQLHVMYTFFKQYNQKLETNGHVLVGRKALQAMVKHDFEVNNVYVAKVISDAELMNFLFADDREFLVTFSRLNDDKLFVIDELKESEIHKWNLFGDSKNSDMRSAEIVFKKNSLDSDLLNTIQKLEPQSLNNRWVLSEMLVLDKKNLFNETSLNCLKAKYDGPLARLDENLEALKKEASPFGHHFSADKSDQLFNCDNLRRPFVQGGLSIKEGLI